MLDLATVLGPVVIAAVSLQPPATEPTRADPAPPDPAITAAETYSILVGQAWSALSSGDTERARTVLDAAPKDNQHWEAAHILAWAKHAAEHTDLSPEQRQGWKLIGGEDSRVNIDIDPSSRWLAFGGSDSKVHIFDLTTGTELKALHALFPDTPPAPPKPPEQDRPALRSVYHAVFSRDGKRLVTGAGDGGICIFDTTSWKLLTKFREDAQFIASLSVNPDASRIAVVTTGKNATLWTLTPSTEPGAATSYKQAATLGPAMNFGRPVAFTHDGAKLALGGMTACELFDGKTGDAIAGEAGKLGGGAPYCMSIAFSPDGKFMATGCRGSVAKSVYLYGTDNKRIYEFLRHTKGVQGLNFSADSRRLLTTSIDGSARLLDTPTGVELLTLDAGAPIRSGVFSADGKYLALGTAKGVRLYGPPPAAAAKK